MDDLSKIREEIDRIDTEILGLFERRMACSERVARHKLERSLPILDEGREGQKVSWAMSQVPEGLRDHAASLMRKVMELSRAYQREHIASVLGEWDGSPDDGSEEGR